MNFLNVFILYGMLASVSCVSLFTAFKKEWEVFKVNKDLIYFLVYFYDTLEQSF